MKNKKSNSSTERRTLSKALIIEGAVALADEIGVGTLTIRKLADALDVKPMTIYYYVPNKDAIIDGMVDKVFSEIDLPPGDKHWKQAMQLRCTSARSVLARHTWAVPLLESSRNPGPGTLTHHNEVLGCLRRAGLSLELTGHAYALIDAFVYGFAIQEANLPAASAQEKNDLVENVVGSVDMGEYPYLMEFTTKHVLQPNYNFGNEFEFGLNLILDGLANAAS